MEGRVPDDEESTAVVLRDTVYPVDREKRAKTLDGGMRKSRKAFKRRDKQRKSGTVREIKKVATFVWQRERRKRKIKRLTVAYMSGWILRKEKRTLLRSRDQSGRMCSRLGCLTIEMEIYKRVKSVEKMKGLVRSSQMMKMRELRESGSAGN